jgi:hypothetical protein
MQAGYILHLAEGSLLTILTFGCTVLGQTRLQFKNPAESATCACFFNEYLPKIVIGTSGGRILILKMFAALRGQAYDVDAEGEVVEAGPGSPVRQVAVRRASHRAFYNLCWVNSEGQVKIAF